MKGKARFPVILVWAFLILTLAALVPAGSHPAVAQNRDIGGVGPAPGESGPAAAAWLYVVGINDYQYVQKLKTATADAQAVRDLLFQKYQFDRSRLGERYDKEATRELIINDLYALARKLSPEDSLFIFYAGHGYEDKIMNQGYWIPVDAKPGNIASYISNSDIRTALAGIPARHIWLVSDSCFSGTLLGERSLPEAIDDRYYREKYKLPSRQVMTSGGNEPVSDQSGSRDCQSHSVFSCYFLKTLRNSSKTYLTPTELFPEVAHIVSLNSNQTPVLGDLRQAGHEGGEFILIARATVSQPSPVALPAPTAPAAAPAPSYAGADTSTLQDLEKRAGQREEADKARQQQLGVEKKKYATDLETYYQKVSSLERRATLTPAEKAAAWADFLSKFPADHPTWGQNPQAQAAQTRKSYWEAEANKAPAKAVSLPVAQAPTPVAHAIVPVQRPAPPSAEFSPPDAKGGPMVFVKDFNFYIDKFEVTNQDFQQCVTAGECQPNKKFKGFTEPTQPVVGVRQENARAYCQWAGKRLPTSSEWTRAAQGTDGRAYPWGNSEPTCNQANFSDCNFSGKTVPVGSTPAGASPYGALDMSGNAYEWVQEDGVLRGGSYINNGNLIKTTSKLDDQTITGVDKDYGIRCAHN